MPLFTICNISIWCPPECVCEVSAQNTPQIIYYIILKMPILSGSRNTLIFVPVSLNPNELLLPPSFQNRAAPFQLVPAKNICLGSDYHVYRAEIMRFKPY